MSKIFVGGLSKDITNDSLGNFFAGLGEIVDAIVIKDRESGCSRGFGFVTFSDTRVARIAADSLDNTEFDGRLIRVDVTA